MLDRVGIMSGTFAIPSGETSANVYVPDGKGIGRAVDNRLTSHQHGGHHRHQSGGCV